MVTHAYTWVCNVIKMFCIRDIACLYRTLRILKIKAIIRWGEGREKVLYVRMTYNNVPQKTRGKREIFFFSFLLLRPFF